MKELQSFWRDNFARCIHPRDAQTQTLSKMEEEDPFAFLLANSKPSLSQEEKLRSCPFAREHDHFMDSDTQSTSQPTGIIMESLPDTDAKDVQDDDKFLTPPEHHFYSVSDSDEPEFAPTEARSELTVDCGGGGGGGGFGEVGSSELAKSEDFGTKGDVGVGNYVMANGDLGKRDAFEAEGDVGVGIEEVGSGNLGEIDDFGETGSVGVGIEEVGRGDFGEEGNVGVGIEVAEADLEGKGCDYVIKDHELEVCRDEFDDKEVLGGETVSNEVTAETLEVGVEIDCVIGTQECDYMVHNTETEVVLSEFGDNGVLDEEIMSKKSMVSKVLDLGVCGLGTCCVEEVQHVENINTEIILDSKEHAEEITSNLNLAKKDHHEGDIVSKRNLFDGNMEEVRGLNALSRGENELLNGEGVDEVENGGHKENVSLRIRGKRKLRGSDLIKSGKSKEDIEKFKYVKRSVGADQRGEDERVLWEGNVPMSKTEKGPLIEVGHGSVYKGNNSFLNLVYKASEVLKSEMDLDHEVDLLEVLKKKGITFPRPRWWPPEGF